jgi:hypothetical protein
VTPHGSPEQLTDRLRPRSKPRRLHDALGRLLSRYLDHGLGGISGKVPVQISVTLTAATVSNAPGAPPARTDSGRLVPTSVVKRWWCDSTVTGYVLSLGGKALRSIHTQRTLTGTERKALTIESGGQCAGDGCCPDTPDPQRPLRPHHILGYAEDQITSLDDTIAICDALHHDIHDRHHTVRLRDGRYLNEHGYTTQPNPFEI